MPDPSVILAACGGFLLAVLWMDLMFDVQVLRHDGPELPEEVLASIAGYYGRVTTDARPMGHLVGTVMGVLGLALAAELFSGPFARAVVSLVLAAPPIVLAAFRVVPNAIRLGTRADAPARQSELARAICRDHLFCVAAILCFLAVRFTF